MTLAVIHGHGEHGGRYADLAHAMARHQIATYALDMRGHGASDGPRGHAMSWDELIADLVTFEAMVRTVAIGEVVPLGHSVGGSILLSAVVRGRLKPKRFVVSSPALRLMMVVPAWKLSIGRVASRVVPNMALDTDLNAEHISRDPTVVAAYRADPQNHSKMSARFYTEWQLANQQILDRAAEIEIPFFATQGSGDLIVDPSGTKDMHDRARAEGRRLIIYPGVYHEPYNDIGREQVYADLAAWLLGSGPAPRP